MFVAGTSRRQIARTLNAAYANGLLSEETFVQRTDHLLAGGVIDPIQLVGDLTFRRRRPSRLTDAKAVVTRLLGHIPGLLESSRRRPPALLALDWSGAHDEMLIGRHRSCQVILSDLSVSRRHARLFFRDGRWIVQDLDSTNGTEVNGSPVGRCELRPGDEITIGDQRLTID